jgi:hypothetical protein
LSDYAGDVAGSPQLINSDIKLLGNTTKIASTYGVLLQSKENEIYYKKLLSKVKFILVNLFFVFESCLVKESLNYLVDHKW